MKCTSTLLIIAATATFLAPGSTAKKCHKKVEASAGLQSGQFNGNGDCTNDSQCPSGFGCTRFNFCHLQEDIQANPTWRRDYQGGAEGAGNPGAGTGVDGVPTIPFGTDYNTGSGGYQTGGAQDPNGPHAGTEPQPI
ncbi:hypothetical protein IWQ60_009742 [Tieghemiomyces parasiticus]|uniref:Chitin-binding type-1 domain-containing protein n=1 Tax=Tieghemiomyces parasiticus TaxID=78921 RepID=A0A9W8DNU8_9FUNG|nr:hypothetical protein IWQ60_009742 [Tieghemiomyces parasiticus]